MYNRLPAKVCRLTDKNFGLLKSDHQHPSGQFKPVGKAYRSARVGLHHRALAIRADRGALIWFWIESHTEYDNLAK